MNKLIPRISGYGDYTRVYAQTHVYKLGVCKGLQWVLFVATDSKLVADVPVSAPQTQVAQLEATIRSAHALLQAGLIDEATSLLAAFSTEVQPNIDRELTEVRSNLD